jgi:hypothetical protein
VNPVSLVDRWANGRSQFCLLSAVCTEPCESAKQRFKKSDKLAGSDGQAAGEFAMPALLTVAFLGSLIRIPRLHWQEASR